MLCACRSENIILIAKCKRHLWTNVSFSKAPHFYSAHLLKTTLLTSNCLLSLNEANGSRFLNTFIQLRLILVKLTQILF